MPNRNVDFVDMGTYNQFLNIFNTTCPMIIFKKMILLHVSQPLRHY